jgi:hypothetical protein
MLNVVMLSVVAPGVGSEKGSCLSGKFRIKNNKDFLLKVKAKYS